MHRVGFVFLGFLFFQIFCGNKENFTSSPQGFDYKYIKEYKNNNQAQTLDFVDIKVKYYFQDSLIFDSEHAPGDFIYQINTNTDSESLFDKALLMMREKEHILFLIDAENFYKVSVEEPLPDYISAGDKLLFDIYLQKIIAQHEMQERKKAFERQQAARQQLLIKSYTEREAESFEKASTGIYKTQLEAGTGRKIQKGDVVSVHYEGRFIDGFLFDSSFERGEPFKFVLGETPLIEAWEAVLPGMKQHEKIRIIAPYQTAYGSEGFGNTIPPYSTLIFDIKILEIN